MNADLRKKAKIDFKKTSLNWWIMQVLQKLWKMWEKIEILNLSQQKEEGIIWCCNQLSYYKDFHWKFISNRNEKDINTYE